MGYFGSFGAGSTPTLWSLLSNLASGAGGAGAGSGLGGDLHSWLSSLMGGAPPPAMQPGSGNQMLIPSNPYTGQSYPPVGASPATYPAGSMMLTPGGPSGGTPVGGQPAAPSVGDMGPNYNYWQNPTMTAHHALNQALIQQGLSAASAGPTPAAVSATSDALSRAAAYRQMLLGS